jgi:hypothetical protein
MVKGPPDRSRGNNRGGLTKGLPGEVALVSERPTQPAIGDTSDRVLTLRRSCSRDPGMAW